MTAVSVSLPQIQRLLHASNIQIQWVINAYLLTLSVFIIMSGRLGDMYGHRRIFLIGALLFFFASIGCANAPNIQFLIASRAFQGFSAALLTPSSSTIMLNTFAPIERGKATGIYVGSASIFLAIGPFLGGVLTQWASWRWIFWINVPLLIFSIVVLRKFLPKDNILKKLPLDWWGLIVLTIAVSSLVFSVMQGNIYGWQSTVILVLFIFSIVM
jgi:MFS family permease